ncbi:Signal recognition particle 14 kDa protein [Strongyloides ratti]|uniref:Signal recognition particle 14 kDa protein n=1 Tax=Strongyloides ratti TaxID=34506 RepID=A0A090KXN8_STRRB|nr:Signal recognition particle 14 kDa protein [Strongyloides ratti]CEF62171.1 Signal recognition particle 14 kDa protein [Strongyloides ratti]
MVLLDNDAFIVRLSDLMMKTRLGGSSVVNLTLKQYDDRKKPISRDPTKALQENKKKLCLFRATIGSKKISTVVEADNVERFHNTYVNVVRGNATSLQKDFTEKRNLAQKKTKRAV